jgi:hypothetical protein
MSETCRDSCHNKFVKLVHIVGFIIKKFVTMHGHMNEKLPIGLFIFLFTFGSYKFVFYNIVFLFFVCIFLLYLFIIRHLNIYVYLSIPHQISTQFFCHVFSCFRILRSQNLTTRLFHLHPNAVIPPPILPCICTFYLTQYKEPSSCQHMLLT